MVGIWTNIKSLTANSDFGFTHSFTIKKQDTMSAYTGNALVWLTFLIGII